MVLFCVWLLLRFDFISLVVYIIMFDIWVGCFDDVNSVAY